MNDRRAHAEVIEFSDPLLPKDIYPRGQIVRYDRAGKWYLEWPVSWQPGTPVRLQPPLIRRKLTVTRAAELAHQFGAEVYTGLPGGSVFDREYWKASLEPRPGIVIHPDGHGRSL